MIFFRKKRKPSTSPKSLKFEMAFEKRLGRLPVDYIAEKIANGSDESSIRYLFDILSAEIGSQNRCKSLGFDHYYKLALLIQPPSKPQPTEPAPPKVTRGFAASQLIGKDRFLMQYRLQLKVLSDNREFMQFIKDLRKQLAGLEIRNIPVANRQIADYFYKNHANDRFPEVREIVEAVLYYGKQASAHISIYYAMYLYQ